MYIKSLCDAKTKAHIPKYDFLSFCAKSTLGDVTVLPPTVRVHRVTPRPVMIARISTVILLEKKMKLIKQTGQL